MPFGIINSLSALVLLSVSIAGDSPTRKSVYDAIGCGCIPVFFQLSRTPFVTWPYQDVLDYTKFSLTVPIGQNFTDFLEPYYNDIKRVRELQRGLYTVMPFMQYSFPIDNRQHSDAMKMILDEVGRHFKLNVTVGKPIL